MEFDHEGTPTKLGHAGIVSAAEAKYFTTMMDTIQRALGPNYTVRTNARKLHAPARTRTHARVHA